MRVILIVAALLVASCAPPATSASGSPGTSSTTGTSDESAETKACRARGGEMRRICLMGEWTCVEKYPDAGKPCTDKDQCMGQCRYAGSAPVGASVVGECQRTTDPCGCFGTVEKGKLLGTLCVD